MVISSYAYSIDEALVSVVTISPKFQVVIPLEVREAMRLEPGQKLQVFHHQGRIEFVPVAPMRSLRGFLKGIETDVPREDRQ